jgi:hypothetical protein
MCVVLMGTDIFHVLDDRSLVSVPLLLDESPQGVLLTSVLGIKEKICVQSGKVPLFYRYLWHHNQYNNFQVPSSN